MKKTVSESPSKASSYTRVFADKDGSSKSEETFNRESTEKKTTILDGKPEDGNYTKTTITEREETIEKREVLKFTEVGKRPSRSPQKILEEYRAKRDKEIDESEKKQRISKPLFHIPFRSVLTETLVVAIDLSSKKSDDTKTLGSPSRFGSCRDTGNAVDEVFSSPIRRSRLDLSLSPSKSASKTNVKRLASSESPSEGNYRYTVDDLLN